MRLGPLLLLAGCVTLDGFIYNPVHCTNVGPDTCEGKGPWNGVCDACDTPYDWQRDYAWDGDALAGGVSIRPVPDGWITRETPTTTDGQATLDAYWLPSHGEDPALAQITVFYNHGNYASIEHYQPRVRILWELGYNVYVWDYRGFGKTEPALTPTAEQFMADARQMRARVAELAPDPSRVLVYGYSLGGLPAVEAALADPPCALVLESPFTSTSSLAHRNAASRFPESFLSEGRFDNFAKVARYPGPLFAMIGTEDRLFLPEDLQRMVDGAPGPKELWILEGAAHGVDPGGVVEAGIGAYGDRVRGFLETHAPACL